MIALPRSINSWAGHGLLPSGASKKLGQLILSSIWFSSASLATSASCGALASILALYLSSMAVCVSGAVGERTVGAIAIAMLSPLERCHAIPVPTIVRVFTTLLYAGLLAMLGCHYGVGIATKSPHGQQPREANRLRGLPSRKVAGEPRWGQSTNRLRSKRKQEMASNRTQQPSDNLLGTVAEKMRCSREFSTELSQPRDAEAHQRW